MKLLQLPPEQWTKRNFDQPLQSMIGIELNPAHANFNSKSSEFKIDANTLKVSRRFSTNPESLTDSDTKKS